MDETCKILDNVCKKLDHDILIDMIRVMRNPHSFSLIKTI